MKGPTWNLNTSGDPSNAPIFVVGMPRSGSTLVEQIISTHSTVFAGGEDTPFAPLMSQMIPEIYQRAGQSAGPLFQQYGGEYVTRMLERANLNNGTFTRFTDKHLMNFWLIGVLHMVLPNARIVHTIRDPMDTLHSCFKHRFEKGSIDFSYAQVCRCLNIYSLHHNAIHNVVAYCVCSQEDLAQFYRLYRMVMEHWDEVIPASKLLTVHYEELVNDQERHALVNAPQPVIVSDFRFWYFVLLPLVMSRVTRQIFEHCQLDWEESALRFYESDRQVLTHSAGQVRRPLYNGSIGAWKQYEEDFLPLVSE